MGGKKEKKPTVDDKRQVDFFLLFAVIWNRNSFNSNATCGDRVYYQILLIKIESELLKRSSWKSVKQLNNGCALKSNWNSLGTAQ